MKTCKKNCTVEDIKLPSDEVLEDNADILKSLADLTRLKILYLLKNGELCVCEIIEILDKSQSTISHHLNILKKAGIISARKEGTWSYYKLSNKEFLNNLENIIQVKKYGR